MNEDSYRDDMGRYWIWKDGSYKIVEDIPLWRYINVKKPKKRKNHTA